MVGWYSFRDNKNVTMSTPILPSLSNSWDRSQCVDQSSSTTDATQPKGLGSLSKYGCNERVNLFRSKVEPQVLDGDGVREVGPRSGVLPGPGDANPNDCRTRSRGSYGAAHDLGSGSLSYPTEDGVPWYPYRPS